MLNKPIPYNFDYSFSRESESFKSEINAKPYPYKLNYPTGLSCGSYRFRYDRRCSVHIEKRDSSYVIFPDDMTIENGELSYISLKNDIDMSEPMILSSLNYEEIILEKYIGLKRTLKKQVVLNRERLLSTVIRELNKNREKQFTSIDKIIDKNEEIDIETSNSNSKIVKENGYVFKKLIDQIFKDKEWEMKNQKYIDIDKEKDKKYVLDKPNKLLDKEEGVELDSFEHIIHKSKEFILDSFEGIIHKAKENTLELENSHIDKGFEFKLMENRKEITTEKNVHLLSTVKIDVEVNDLIKSLSRAQDIYRKNTQLKSLKNISKKNIDKKILDFNLLKRLGEDSLLKDFKESYFNINNTKESIVEDEVIFHKNIGIKELDIYAESLWGRLYSEIIKREMVNEGLMLFKDREMDINTNKFILELIQDINIYKILDEVGLEITNNKIIYKENELIFSINKLIDIEKELESQTFFKLPIGDISNIISDIQLENITKLELTKDGDLSSLVKEATIGIIKDISFENLSKDTAKDLETVLTDIILDSKSINNIEKEDRDIEISRYEVKDMFKDIQELDLDTARFKDIDIKGGGVDLEVERIKDLEMDNKSLELIVERVLSMEKEIKRFILDKDIAKEALFGSIEQLFDKSDIKETYIDDRELSITRDAKDVDVNKFDYYYRRIIITIEKNRYNLLDKNFKLIIEDLFEAALEKVEKDISVSLTLQLEKEIIKEMIKDSLEILLVKSVTKYIYKDVNDIEVDRVFEGDIYLDIKEFLSDKIRNDTKIYLEDEGYEIDKITQKQIIDNLFNDGYLMELVSDILIEVNEESILNISVKDIMTYIFKELEKHNGEITINQDLPLIRLYREIKKDKPDTSLVRLEPLINKVESIALDQEFRNIEKLKEKNLDLYKRFWFLRATDPLDWKIVPYNNFPYEDEPVIFDENKEMIPENWQLEMVDVENKLFKKIDENPVPFGKGVSNLEMALSIEIMIEMINILILLWSRLFYAFTGYTGTQSVTRLTRTLYEWLTLETSINAMDNKKSKEHYMRVYRWIRWEAEKVAIKARDDMNLNGNFYIDEFIFELIYYMENHHFDTMPLFEVVNVMDEYRALIPSDEPQGNIRFVLDKVKGIRHKILDCKEKRNNE